MLVVIAPAVVAAGVESNEKWEPVRTIISFICQWAPPEKQEQQPAGLQEGVFREREESPNGGGSSTPVISSHLHGRRKILEDPLQFLPMILTVEEVGNGRFFRIFLLFAFHLR